MNDIKRHPLYARHNLDSAMSSLWDYYRKNFISLFIISLVISFITQLAASTIDLGELQSMTDTEEMIAKMKEYIVPGIIIILISLYFNIVLQHYIIYKPVDESNNFLTSLAKALRYYLPFLVIMILFGFMATIGMALGILALIIGVFFVALYLLMLYLFILPVLMLEGADIGRTINRTFTLAHRNFWSNMGTTAVFLIIMIVISLILSGVIMIPFSGNFLKTIFSPEKAGITDIQSNPVYIILSSLAGAVTLPVIPILSCILYFNARVNEEEGEKAPAPEEYRPKIEDLYSRPPEDNV